MNVVDMHGITKSFHGIKVLDNVDFSVQKGEVHALCGENGAGKSTLMKILSGIYTRDEGEIYFKGNKLKELDAKQMMQLGISMIFQELNLLNELTIAQNIFLNREKVLGKLLLNEKQMINQAHELLKDVLEIDPSIKVRELSIAQKQIIEIVKAISFNADLIIMDEPTAVLTKKEVDILYAFIRKLKSKGVSIIYISHRLAEIKEICDRVTILRDGRLISTAVVCDISEHDIAKLMVGREIVPSSVKKYDRKIKRTILQVENITCDTTVKDASFELMDGETIGFYGLVGAGRSELAEAIFGVRKISRGVIRINGEEVDIKNPYDAIQRKIAFATEDRRGNGLFNGRSISENINTILNIKETGVIINESGERVLTEKMKKAFNIKFSSPRDDVMNLSGGNQQKVVFGKWAASEADIYIFDEPTRGVDIGARKEIYDYIRWLAENGKSIIIISSDLPELLETCQRIIVMHQGVIRGELTHDEATEERIMFLATGLERGKNHEC